jgi:hypothetical protein
MTAFLQIQQDQHSGRQHHREPRGRQRRRWRLAAVVLIPVLLLAGLGGQAYARLQPSGPVKVLQPGGDVGCFHKPSLRADVAVVSLQNRDPVAACAQVWAAGAFNTGWFGTRIGQDNTAPDLVACVTSTGGLGVFPGKPGDCQRLDLREPTPDEVTGQKMFDEVEQAIVRRAVPPPGGCAAPEQVRAIVNEELAAGGLTDWRVTVATPDGAPARFTSDMPCATLSFDTTRRAVYLVPMPE